MDFRRDINVSAYKVRSQPRKSRAFRHRRIYLPCFFRSPRPLLQYRFVPREFRKVIYCFACRSEIWFQRGTPVTARISPGHGCLWPAKRKLTDTGHPVTRSKGRPDEFNRSHQTGTVLSSPTRTLITDASARLREVRHLSISPGQRLDTSCGKCMLMVRRQPSNDEYLLATYRRRFTRRGICDRGTGYVAPTPGSARNIFRPYLRHRDEQPGEGTAKTRLDTTPSPFPGASTIALGRRTSPCDRSGRLP
jgi:hypothetical protein